MQFNIRGENIEITPALREHVEKKLSRLERYFNSQAISTIYVTMRVMREHFVEVTIPLEGIILRAEERSEDMYASIDTVVDKLERQIRKYKTKINRKLRYDGNVQPSPIRWEDKDAAEEEDQFKIVKTKRFNFKPMDIDEAILQMNLLGHSFFVFSNVETNETNVVYRRQDGRFGLIEPE
jgi:putative sigma-54 modulation protein